MGVVERYLFVIHFTTRFTKFISNVKMYNKTMDVKHLWTYLIYVDELGDPGFAKINLENEPFGRPL